MTKFLGYMSFPFMYPENFGDAPTSTLSASTTLSISTFLFSKVTFGFGLGLDAIQVYKDNFGRKNGQIR